jgi:hypothetical protein
VVELTHEKDLIDIIKLIVAGRYGGGLVPGTPADIERLLGLHGPLETSTRKGQTRRTARRAYMPKKPRKVSSYHKDLGVCLKALKKKHPRTAVPRLMKRAHACARKKKKARGG